MLFFLDSSQAADARKMSSSASSSSAAIIHRPNPRAFLSKTDYHSHSVRGLLAGSVPMMLAVLNLALFFGLEHHRKEDVSVRGRGTIGVHGLGVLLTGVQSIQLCLQA